MRSRIGLLCLCLLLLTGCGAKPAPSIKLATTTSVRDTGLLDELTALFHKQTGIEVQVIAVGTGQALELGRRGDADVLIVHDPISEKQFMDNGYGESHRPIMHNDFVIVGSRTDKAGVRGTKTAVEAFRRIAAAGANFVSRGDESGTHLREKRIWELAETTPNGKWYIRSGGGMAMILGVADEKRAYTLSDRGTYLALRDKIDLTILHEGDPLLLNRYSVIVVKRDEHRPAEHQRAREFADFLVAPETRKVIGEFGVERFGQPLFIPEESETVRD
jgi:tungstate transport system substrate-binding protein